MKKKTALLILGLMFLSGFAVVNAQTPAQIGPSGNLMIGPYGNLKIGPYGNLVGLTDTQGKDVLSQIREGYAIAYQVKNPKGGYQDRLVYALGDQLSSGLIVDRQKSTETTKVVTTKDKVLEISRTFSWDTKTESLKSEITITNVGTEGVELRGIEAQIDSRLLAALVDEKDTKPLPHFLEPSILCKHIAGRAGRDCYPQKDCPTCPCFPRCNRGQPKGFLREPNSPKSAFEGDPFAGIPSFNGSLFCLAWSGSNLVDSTLKPGGQSPSYYEVRR
jgi:hypothetical protein